MKNWDTFLKEEQEKEYYKEMMNKLSKLEEDGPVYPSEEDRFSCFTLCPYENVKVVILGQDPYHRKGQAHGLSFSVKPGVKTPPSLQNIYKELESDLGIEKAQHGNLEAWAKQGVLMMNTIWSVSEGKPGSHKAIGWQTFTEHLLQELNAYPRPLIFLLWGNHAKEYASLLDDKKHILLMAAHPSPLARGAFFGSKPFSKTNACLKEMGYEEIDWSLPKVI